MSEKKFKLVLVDRVTKEEKEYAQYYILDRAILDARELNNMERQKGTCYQWRIEIAGVHDKQNGNSKKDKINKAEEKENA
ncbi:MAG: hypothetical protein LBJ25_00355 [Candidatus Margulisbacteria bacterium]|jgi:hypothetical protein|nr:hypothetical protein [Candidatus Margulisiibacteriota bacterium]